MNNRFKLIVFDWDGTLMDSEAQITQSLSNVIAELALAERSNHDLRNVIGLGLPEAIRRLYPNEGETTVAKFVDRYRHHFLVGNQNRSVLFNGAMEVIKHLHADDYLLAVATGKSRRGLDRSIAETRSGDYFHITRCADETHSKPHPQMLLEIMTVLGVSPEETVMVGDTEYDLQMAAEAGTASLGVTYGVHAVERLQAHKPLACLDNISEVGELLYKD
ncbi:MAG: HAD-IA family hydrolase [Gammaproteobacteria bacterium]|nr:HAD-IA family hydrolase [Gammaproteobacteria bacterium]